MHVLTSLFTTLLFKKHTLNHTQVNVHEIARLYGGDMTYHALQNQLRKIKKDAAAMKEEAAGREGPAPSPAKPRGKKGNASPAKHSKHTLNRAEAAL